jgi:hypothetical protein
MDNCWTEKKNSPLSCNPEAAMEDILKKTVLVQRLTPRSFQIHFNKFTLYKLRVWRKQSLFNCFDSACIISSLRITRFARLVLSAVGKSAQLSDSFLQITHLSDDAQGSVISTQLLADRCKLFGHKHKLWCFSIVRYNNRRKVNKSFIRSNMCLSIVRIATTH